MLFHGKVNRWWKSSAAGCLSKFTIRRCELAEKLEGTIFPSHTIQTSWLFHFLVNRPKGSKRYPLFNPSAGDGKGNGFVFSRPGWNPRWIRRKSEHILILGSNCLWPRLLAEKPSRAAVVVSSRKAGLILHLVFPSVVAEGSQEAT